MRNAITDIKNYFQMGLASQPLSGNREYMHKILPGQQPNTKTPVFQISRTQFERIKVDIQKWREAIVKAENVYNPQRADMQRIFQDTGFNEHVLACTEKRKDLTLLRKFKMCDSEGNIDEKATELFNTTWFNNFQSYALDALFYGYNLIQLGDIENDAYPNLSFVARENVNPDKMIVSRFVYSLVGQRFDEGDFKDWYIYIKTPTTTGKTKCGYGLFYTIGKTEIYMRNNTGQNADYNETFGQPIRKGTTTKRDDERDIFESALRTMGSNAYILLDEGSDTLELVEQKGAGRSFETYSNFEKRCEAKITKALLGHADALDSTPGKLGATQGDKSPAEMALTDKQTKDAEFLEPIINTELIPRMRRQGFIIPDGLKFMYINDAEKEEFRAKEDESNQKSALVMKTIKDAGGDISDEGWQYFSDRTGIPGITKPEAPEPAIMEMNQPDIKTKKVAALQDQLRKATGYKKGNIQNRIKALV